MTEKRQRREYSEDFKRQMVELHRNGKPRSEIVREYELTPSALDRWIGRINTTGSSKVGDNRTIEERELLALRRENQRLRMENDILKQAALILGRR